VSVGGLFGLCIGMTGCFPDCREVTQSKDGIKKEREVLNSMCG
jgi:hypothetical protein